MTDPSRVVVVENSGDVLGNELDFGSVGCLTEYDCFEGGLF